MGTEILRKIRHRVEYLFLLGLVLLTWMFSLKGILLLGDLLGWFAFSVLGVRRKVVLDNLSRAFPEKSEKKLLIIARKSYQNFAKMTLEYMRFPRMTGKDVISLCRLEGEKNLEYVLRKGKGAVLVGGHFGNWELMGAALVQLGYSVSFLVGEQHNKLVDDMMNCNRALMGIKIIHMGMAVRGVLKALRNNGFVALLSDQDAGRDGVFVNFFGRPASTPQGPAVFVLKTGAPIIFGSAVRLPGGKHRIICELLSFDHLHGLTSENIREVTQSYTSLLERIIRAYPDHWFWMHRRWKSRPLNEMGEK